MLSSSVNRYVFKHLFEKSSEAASQGFTKFRGEDMEAAQLVSLYVRSILKAVEERGGREET